eukprot:PLAT1179.1.p1 GENE.PLAT1179.1~~PLAT1179.1.p1  ORF type:complete len:326 (+),score=169.70 PLAT1179.1:149-1126(+)
MMRRSPAIPAVAEEVLAKPLKTVKVAKVVPSPPFAMKLGIGGVAGVVGASAVFPLDMVKTQLQNQRPVGGKLPYSGPVDCARKMFASGGMRSFYRGLLPNLVGIIPEKGIKLAVNDELRCQLLKAEGGDKLPLWKEVLAGAGAGLAQFVATNPMEIVKIRMQVEGQAVADASKRRTAMQHVRELGFRGLYKGSAATLARDIPFSMIFFAQYAKTREAFADARGGQASFGEVLLAGCAAGMTSAALTTPMDVVKTRLQAEVLPGQPVFTGVRQTAAYILEKEGFAAFWRGWRPRVMIVAPLFALSLVAYELQGRYMAARMAEDDEE